MNNTPYTYIKFFFTGSFNSGKTALFLYYTTEKSNIITNATIGIDYLDKFIKIKDNTYKLGLFDSAGQERYSHYVICNIKNYNIYFISLNIENKIEEELENIHNIIKIIQDLDNIDIYIFITKTDKCQNFNEKLTDIKRNIESFFIKKEQWNYITGIYNTSIFMDIDELNNIFAEIVKKYLIKLKNYKNNIYVNDNTAKIKIKNKNCCI